MKDYNNKILELPKKGKAMIVTDLHGNLEDFNTYMEIWKQFKNDGNHFILTGDFIHGTSGFNDGSVEILEKVKWNFEHLDNFHVLLGNHEWAHIADMSVCKAGHNQTHEFEELLQKHFHNSWERKLELYVHFFKKLHLAVKTENKVFISHAGPPVNIKNMIEMKNITAEGYIENQDLDDLLWSRPDNYSSTDLINFLKGMGCNISIVGHTAVDGTKKVYDNQLILSSSYSYNRKAYLELDLEMEIETLNDLNGMIRFLN